MPKLNVSNISSLDSLLYVMSEGNPGSITVLLELLSNPDGIRKILTLDSLEIRGTKLYLLYNDCCNKDMAIFERTLKMLNMGVFEEKDIIANLSQTYAIPFIDLSIEMDESLYDQNNINFTNEKWKKYCDENKKIFLEKLKKSLKDSVTPNYMP